MRALSPLGAEAVAAALDAGCLEVVYQPSVSVPDCAVVGAEALARIRDPWSGQVLAPIDFLGGAAAGGLVARIDALVAEAAVPLAARWRRIAPERDFTLSVNLCVSGLHDTDLPARLTRLADDHGLPLDALVVEVTETVLSLPGRGHEQVLRALCEAGVQIEIDDFGTGSASIDYLRRFPVQGLKVDRSFVQDLGGSPLCDRLARAVVRFGVDLGVRVVAEGVESPHQLLALDELGCPVAQGYLMSEPLTATAMEALVTSRAGLAPEPVVLDLTRF